MTYLSVTKTQNPSGNDFKFWLHHHQQISYNSPSCYQAFLGCQHCNETDVWINNNHTIPNRNSHKVKDQFWLNHSYCIWHKYNASQWTHTETCFESSFRKVWALKWVCSMNFSGSTKECKFIQPRLLCDFHWIYIVLKLTSWKP